MSAYMQIQVLSFGLHITSGPLTFQMNLHATPEGYAPPNHETIFLRQKPLPHSYTSLNHDEEPQPLLLQK